MEVARGAGEIVAHDDLDRHHRKPPAHQDVGVGIFDDVVGTDALRRLEPETGGLRQHLALERDDREVAVEGADAIRGDDDARAIGEVVVLAHLAPVPAGKLGNDRVGKGMVCVGGERGRVDHIGWGHRSAMTMPGSVVCRRFRLNVPSASPVELGSGRSHPLARPRASDLNILRARWPSRVTSTRTLSRTLADFLAIRPLREQADEAKPSARGIPGQPHHDRP